MEREESSETVQLQSDPSSVAGKLQTMPVASPSKVIPTQQSEDPTELAIDVSSKESEKTEGDEPAFMDVKVDDVDASEKESEKPAKTKAKAKKNRALDVSEERMDNFKLLSKDRSKAKVQKMNKKRDKAGTSQKSLKMSEKSDSAKKR